MARLTVEIDDKLYQKFRRVCKQNHSDVSKTIRIWITSYLEKQEKATAYKQASYRKGK